MQIHFGIAVRFCAPIAPSQLVSLNAEVSLGIHLHGISDNGRNRAEAQNLSSHYFETWSGSSALFGVLVFENPQVIPWRRRKIVALFASQEAANRQPGTYAALGGC
jgi:hypothetical protein